MLELPHVYSASGTLKGDNNITIESTGLPPIVTAAPAEFGGPGDLWSPEALLIAAVADCFLLTFRAISRASKFDWLELKCSAEGTLDKVDRLTRFTAVTINASLSVDGTADETKARRLLEKAEASCLISNSLLADRHLEINVVVIT